MPAQSPATVLETVTLAEGASMIDRPDSTLRDWIKKGFVQAQRDKRGRWLLDRATLLAAAAASPTAAAAISGRRGHRGVAVATAAPTNDLITMAYIRSLEATIDREREENKDLRMQVKNLEGEWLKLTAELKAILTDKGGGKGLMRWIQSVRV